MPQLRTVFAESYAELDEMIRFSAAVERRLSQCLSDGSIPDNDLIDAISVCKIRCIDAASQRVYALRQEVGSYALMGGTGFELNDMFLCTKFAEGNRNVETSSATHFGGRTAYFDPVLPPLAPSRVY
jgi:acyl-CoA oxidase